MKSLSALIAVLLVTVFLAPSRCLSKIDTGLIRVPDDDYAEKERSRPEADLHKKAEQLEGVLKRYTAAQDFKNARHTYLTLGRVYERLRQYNKVGQCYERALGLFQKIGHTIGEAQALSNLRWLKWQFGYYEEAEEFYAKALESTKNQDARRNRWHMRVHRPRPICRGTWTM